MISSKFSLNLTTVFNSLISYQNEICKECSLKYIVSKSCSIYTDRLFAFNILVNTAGFKHAAITCPRGALKQFCVLSTGVREQKEKRMQRPENHKTHNTVLIIVNRSYNNLPSLVGGLGTGGGVWSEGQSFQCL